MNFQQLKSINKKTYWRAISHNKTLEFRIIKYTKCTGSYCHQAYQCVTLNPDSTVFDNESFDTLEIAQDYCYWLNDQIG